MGAKMVCSLVFQPPSPPAYLASQKHFWLFTSKGNRIPAVYYDRSAPITILFSHGNAEDLGMVYDWIFEFARQLNVNVLAYEYSGYGKTIESVEPSEASCYADIEAAFNHLMEVKKVSPNRIVLYGRSLGSGPSCYLAQKLSQNGTPVGGVILQSPILSAYRVAVPFRFTLPGDLFPNIDRMADIDSPVFVIHGTRDEIVPLSHGQELFLRCQVRYRARPFWVEEAGHNNIESMLREDGSFFRRIQDFLVQINKHSRAWDI